MGNTVTKVENQKSIIEIFMNGCKNGFYIGLNNILPAMVLGFTIVQFLQLTGLVPIIGNVFGPIMQIFGLPGESVVVLVSAFFAKAAGAATAANMYSQGMINEVQATILLLPCMLMGTLVGHYARVILVGDANPAHRAILLAIPIIDSVVGMLLMRALLAAMGY